jgi:predicted glycosyltransferase involved in capsule biosynthesis
MDLSIIIAFKSDNGIRDRHLKYVVDRYKSMLPDAEIIVSQDTDSQTENHWKDFCKSKYLNLGVEKSTRSNLLIVDADIILSIESTLVALDNINDYSIIFPYNKLYYLNQETTEYILNNQTLKNISHEEQILKHRKYLTGGIYFVTKENYWKVNGHDERFIGRGSEDRAFSRAILTICGNKFLRLKFESYHLWHPTGRIAVIAEKNKKMREIYESAKNNKDKMLEIIKNNRG